MSDESKALVPFGKYKGQPVEVLSQDREYCDWLAGQDWFRAKFTNIHTLIVNNFREPSETPEHNALQAKFLDPEWLAAFLTVRVGVSHIKEALRRRVVAVANNRDACLQKSEAMIKDARLRLAEMGAGVGRAGFYDLDYYQKRVAALEPIVDDLRLHLRAIQGGVINGIEYRWDHFEWFDMSTEFEQDGIDVLVEAQVRFAGKNTATEVDELTLREWTEIKLEPKDKWSAIWLTHNYKFPVECKPSLGDDYPAVLRQMRASSAGTLLIQQYCGAGATFDQVKRIFEPIKILTTAEIEVR